MSDKPAEKTCVRCKKAIPYGATKCPECHADLRNWFMRHKIISTLLFVFIGIPMLAAFWDAALSDISSNNNNGQPKSEAASDEAVAKQEADARKFDQIVITDSSIKEDIIGTPEWHVTIKNNTDKTIDGVIVQGFFKNNFDEPVGQFNSKSAEAFRGQIQETIKPGASFPAVYNLAVYDSTTKVENISVVKVHFTDGSTIE